MDYILALKSPVTEKSYEKARKDVESAGGKVLYEFRAGFKALQITLPSEQFSTFSAKSYVDFIEEDKSGKKVLK